MDFIDYKDGRPIYEQIAEAYKVLILKGVMEPDEPMPSVRKLAMQLSTNPNTIQRAYSELERQGFLYSVKGRGSFVRASRDQRENKKAELVQRIKDIFAEAAEIGIDKEELIEDLRRSSEGSDDSETIGTSREKGHSNSDDSGTASGGLQIACIKDGCKAEGGPRADNARANRSKEGDSNSGGIISDGIRGQESIENNNQESGAEEIPEVQKA